MRWVERNPHVSRTPAGADYGTKLPKVGFNVHISAYPSTLVSAMSAIRISEAQMRQTIADVGQGGPDALPEAMTSLAVAKLAHRVAIKVLAEADTMMKRSLDLLA